MTNKQKKAINTWCKAYSNMLDRIIRGSEENYNGFDQDLFEAFGCSREPFPEAKRNKKP